LREWNKLDGGKKRRKRGRGVEWVDRTPILDRGQQ